ncbi:MAG: hypothetical protein LBF79_02145 [Dysgonamonadaceae bacterium]|jgi:hypothetical protein|nr:hypothetical protein [Dysgonamonadaceae bacterium]
MKATIKLFTVVLVLSVSLQACKNNAEVTSSKTPQEIYEDLQKDLAIDWNTWDTRSVLTHVYLPHGAAIDINLIDPSGTRKDKFQVGERGKDAPVLHPGTHTFDGTYTDVSVEWKGLKLRVQSTALNRENLILISPLHGSAKGGKIIIKPQSVWFRANKINVSENIFNIAPLGEELTFAGHVDGKYEKTNDNEIVMSADEPTVVCIGWNMSIETASKTMQQVAENIEKADREQYGQCYDVYNAMRNVLAWDNIYDPTINRVITPVSRIWNVGWSSNPSLGGFVLFCWDTYFASMMLSTSSRELAYANAAEITNAITENGFVPNFYAVNNYKSRDRSQPPVGSMAVWMLYMKYHDKWFLELVYDKLLSWNRWWHNNRQTDGLLCWGSSPFEKVTYRWWESKGVNETEGGALESGLDNSHMYDNIPFDSKKHQQKLNDVGLTSLYIMDCNILSKIAQLLGKSHNERELFERAQYYTKNMAKTWDEETGFYYNRHTDAGELDRRISPTNFYPMLAEIPTQAQAERMVNKHLLNPEEFWGEWVIPATPRNDPAYKDNTYWRGRIWAPLNFLVYAGLCNYDLPDARKAFAEKSKNLLLKTWLEHGYVFENYNAETGKGDDVENSDKFYHWGALLGFITLIEEGYYIEDDSRPETTNHKGGN